MFPKIKLGKSNISSKIIPEFDFKIYFDGCSKGNPGISGAGACITYLDDEIWCGSKFVGKFMTNNYAEYMGLIFGLKQAIELNIKKITVVGDSLLVINHMNNIYQCKSINLIPLYEEAKELEKHFEAITYQHVLRNNNKRADYLSNKAIENSQFI